MARAYYTPDYRLSLPLADRVPAGGLIWLLGRVLIGGLFLISGLQKFTGLDSFANELVQGGIPASIAPVLAPVAATVETVGGFCITLGVMTSWVSLFMIAFTIIAALVAHRFWEMQGPMAELQMAHFIKNMMISGAFCLLHVAGGGPFSVDRATRHPKWSVRRDVLEVPKEAPPPDRSHLTDL